MSKTFNVRKTHIKRLKNIDLLHKLLFYYKLSIEKISKAFKRYAGSYRTEIIDSKDPLVQLEASKSNIKDLYKDLLDKINGFKYQMKVESFAKQTQKNGDMEFAPVHFNFTTKTIINSDKYILHKSFQETLYRIDNWINEGSGWVIKSVNKEYVNKESLIHCQEAHTLNCLVD